MSPHTVRTKTKEERAEARRLSALYKRASNDFDELLRSNNLHRVFTITRNYMPNMFRALLPWSGKPEGMIGVVIKNDVMHFYQLMNYGNGEDGHQTPVAPLDNIGNVNLSGNSPEGLYQDVIDAVRKLARANQVKALIKLNSNGLEELMPSQGQSWKPVIVTTDEDGRIIFHDLSDRALQPPH